MRLRDDVVGGMQVLVLVPRPGDDRVAVEAMLEVVGVAPQSLPQPGDVVVDQVEALSRTGNSAGSRRAGSTFWKPICERSG